MRVCRNINIFVSEPQSFVFGHPASKKNDRTTKKREQNTQSLSLPTQPSLGTKISLHNISLTINSLTRKEFI